MPRGPFALLSVWLVPQRPAGQENAQPLSLWLSSTLGSELLTRAGTSRRSSHVLCQPSACAKAPDGPALQL